MKLPTTMFIPALLAILIALFSWTFSFVWDANIELKHMASYQSLLVTRDGEVKPSVTSQLMQARLVALKERVIMLEDRECRKR